MRSPSPIRRRLNAIAGVPHRPGAGVASVLSLAVEGVVFALIVVIWIFYWAATPADAAEVVQAATVCKGSAMIVLGAMLLGVSYLMVRALRRGAP